MYIQCDKYFDLYKTYLLIKLTCFWNVLRLYHLLSDQIWYPVGIVLWDSIPMWFVISIYMPIASISSHRCTDHQIASNVLNLKSNG